MSRALVGLHIAPKLGQLAGRLLDRPHPLDRRTARAAPLRAMPVLADPGYEDAGHGIHVPVKKPAGSKSWTLIAGPGML